MISVCRRMIAELGFRLGVAFRRWPASLRVALGRDSQPEAGAMVDH
jgi:hypothetical protein